MDKLDYTKFSDMTVKIHSHAKEPSHRLLRGRAILNPDEGDFTFVENDLRLNRSKEVGRTEHCRFIRRPDNTYVITFRVSGDEKYLKADLQAEIRDVVAAITEDRKYILKQQKLNTKKDETTPAV